MKRSTVSEETIYLVAEGQAQPVPVNIGQGPGPEWKTFYAGKIAWPKSSKNVQMTGTWGEGEPEFKVGVPFDELPPDLQTMLSADLGITVTRVQIDEHTFQVVSKVDRPVLVNLSAEEGYEVVQALVSRHRLAMNDVEAKRRVERVLLRLGMSLEGLDALHH